MTMFEKISVTLRAAFNEYPLKIARDYFGDEFYVSWKNYRAKHPVETVQRPRGEGSETERLLNVLMGDDDTDVTGPAPVGKKAAAAAAEIHAAD